MNKPGDMTLEGREIEQDGDVTWDMLRTCANCGAEFSELKGKSYNVGRMRVWLCPECSRYGSWQVDGRTVGRIHSMKQKNRS